MESEEDFTDQYIPTLLNEEPVVMFGLNESELFVSILIGIAGSVTINTVLGIFFSLGIFFLVLFLFLAGLGASFTMKWLRNNKAGKPRGYVSMKLKVAMGRRFPKMANSANLYIADKPLSVGRSVRILIEDCDHE